MDHDEAKAGGDTELAARVRALVSELTGVPLAKLTLDTRILHDLGCDGDDAGELFERFSKDFGVDLSGIQWKRHFWPEGGGPGFLILPVLLWRLLRGIPNPEPDLEPVTIRDMVEAARAGRWVKRLPPSPAR